MTFSQWLGRTEWHDDIVAAEPLRRLSATFDRDPAAVTEGWAVPPCWHWVFFVEQPQRRQLGPDGHERRGDFLPPVDLPRRMFSGTHLTFHRPIRVGDRLRRKSVITGIEEKSGRTGRLTFVRVLHEISRDQLLLLSEDQTIVFREAVAGAAPAAAPAPAADWRLRIDPDPVLLFRFSALTFNAHRIHYDHPYVTAVEGYPGLVVHGPLIALLMALACQDAHPQRPLRSYAFRAQRPLFAGTPFHVAGKREGEDQARLWAEDENGGVAMTGEVILGP